MLRAHLERRLALPPALRPWQAQLSILPPELALSVGPWIARLALAIGTLSNERSTVSGEPQGYGGLARRGPYERLLISEWLLAEELPNEFLRRATDGEHVFYELSHSEPAGEQRTVVLFDAGPAQTGPPRIAQLALLLLFAQRAAAVDAVFQWGVLQDRQHRLWDEVTTTSVRHLLEARTVADVTPAQRADWEEHLGEPQALDDQWYVGSPAVRALAKDAGASSAVVLDRLEPGTRQLEVAVRRGPRPATLVQLDLPEPQLCTRLVRDPFAAPPRVAPPEPGLTGKPIGVVLTGHRVGLMGLGGELLTQPFPNTPRGNPGRPKRHVLPPDELPLAVGYLGKRMRIVSVRLFGEDPYRLYGHGIEQGYTGHRVSPIGLAEEPGEWIADAQPLRPFVPLGSGGSGAFMLPDGRLIILQDNWTGEALRVEKVVPATRAIGGGGGALYVVGSVNASSGTRDDHRLYFGRYQPGPPENYCSEEIVDPTDAWAFMGRSPTQTWAALSGKRGRWLLCDDQRRMEVLRPPEELVVVGVACRDVSKGPSLLVLESDERRLTLLGRNHNEPVCKAPARIEQVVVSAAAPVFAYQTEPGDLYVHSWDHPEPLLHVRPGGGP